MRLKDPQVLIGTRVVLTGRRHYGWGGQVVKVREDAAMVRLDNGVVVAVSARDLLFTKLNESHFKM